jgi:outer membrane protein insertion porin family
VGLNYRAESTTTSGVPEANQSAFLFNGTRFTSRVAPTYIHDTRDDFLNPTRGWRHVVRFEVAGGVLGGLDFYKSGYEMTYYHPLFAGLVGAIHGELNYADGYGGSVLPIFERYFMGGPNSLRGYTIRDVGPKDYVGNPLGGTKSLLVNVEVQYPFTKSLRGILFYDRGNVYGTAPGSVHTSSGGGGVILQQQNFSGPNMNHSTENFDLGQMRSSIGGGIRFMSPFGPIGLAYGMKLDRQPGEKVGEFHFSAGSTY